MDIFNEIKRKIQLSGNVTYKFIAVNVAVFLFFGILFVFEKLIFRTEIIDYYYRYYLTLPASLGTLAWHPWTIITYMFLHDGIWHILFNMLFLYWFGKLLEEYLGANKITVLYFLGGIAGGLFFVLSYNIFPYLIDSSQNAYLLGASASVMAILVACATLLPNHTFFLLLFGAVKLKYIAIFIVVIDFISIVGNNPGGMIAHMGGVLVGYLFIVQLRAGNDWALSLTKIKNKITGLFKKKSPLKVKHVNKTRQTSSNKAINQDEIDAILDKISQSGYEKLTAEEKEKLFKASGNSK